MYRLVLFLKESKISYFQPKCEYILITIRLINEYLIGLFCLFYNRIASLLAAQCIGIYSSILS